MTREEIKALDYESVETRAAAIAAELEAADAEKLEILNDELDALTERKAQLDMEIAEHNQAAEEVLRGAGTEIERKEETHMTNKEVRNTQEYMDAFKKYIISGKDAECRSLLTENISGTVPVPEFVENRVRQAWENDKIFGRVPKSFVKGNLKVGFEISATDAAVHEEGDDAPAEETLSLGIVTMVPEMIKKWITVSDEVLALGAEEFLAYVYDELAYKIIQKAADLCVDAVQNAPAASTSAAVGVEQVAAVVDPASILTAISGLGDDARDIVIIASGATIASVRLAALQGSFAFDPFFGAEVIQKEGVTGAIVGDLRGLQINLPEGDAVTFKFDDLSLAEQDLVKIVGRLYAAIALVQPKMFVNITGTESE